MPKGDKALKATRRARVAALLDEGPLSAPQLLERLRRQGFETTERTVRRDVAAIESELREAYLARRWQYKIRQVRAADRRSRLLEAEWERSRADRHRRRAKKTEGEKGEGGGRGGGGRTEAETTVEGRLGDPAYLAECRHNDEHVARLLGLEEPRKLDISDEEMEAAIEADIQEEVDARVEQAVQARLAAMAARGQGAVVPSPPGAGGTAGGPERSPPA
jgi:hypothetical protein